MEVEVLHEFGEPVSLTRKEERRLRSDLSFMTPHQIAEVTAEIDRRLDSLVNNPSPNWGSITNTSIEGGKRNIVTGVDGDWTGTALQYVYEACDQNADEAGLMFGRIFKWVVIGRPEAWGGYRSDERHPTFPNRGILLQGKTYYLLERN
jgi:hypothetical protein